MEHREGRLGGRRNVSIYWQAWLPDGGAAASAPTIVVAHGLGEHSGRYARVAEQLVRQGCAVYAIDHRGHGRSEGRRAYVDRFADAVADIDQLVDLARKARPDAKLFLLGHSMGGALALDYAYAHQGKLDGLILSGAVATLDGTSSVMRAVSRMLSALAPSLGVLKIAPSLVSRDPATVADYAADPLNFHGSVPARTVGEIVAFVERLPAQLPRLTLPILIMHGKADALAGVGGSELVYGGVRSEDKTLHLYDGLFHEIFNEPPADRDKVLADLGAWLHAHSATSLAAPVR